MSKDQKITLRIFAYLTIISFILHIIWENLQAPLYGFNIPFSQHSLLAFMGTLGDVMITLVIFVLISMLLGSWYWIKSITREQVMALTVLGFLIALAIEWWALLGGWWSYNYNMPIIFNSGLSPVLQMTILLPLTFYITSRLLRRNLSKKAS